MQQTRIGSEKKNAKNKTKYQCKLKAPLTIQDIKQSPNTSTIPKHTHHSPHDRPLTPHQEFKILLTPGVFKRNRLHMIGFAEASWL